MNKNLKFALLGALCASGQAQKSWEGLWKVEANDKCCFPEGDLKFEFRDFFGENKLEGKWAENSACKDARKYFSLSESTKVNEKTLTFGDRSFFGDSLEFTIERNDESSATVTSKMGSKVCKTTMAKKRDPVKTDWEGMWKFTANGDAGKCCFPENIMRITNFFEDNWVEGYAQDTAACRASYQTGQKFLHTPKSDTTLSYKAIAAPFTYKIKKTGNGAATFSSEQNGAECTGTLAKLPQHDWTGVYAAPKNGRDSKCCYPADKITVNKSGDSFSIQYAWEDSSACKEAGFSGAVNKGSVGLKTNELYFNDFIKRGGDNVVAKVELSKWEHGVELELFQGSGHWCTAIRLDTLQSTQ